MCIRDRIETVEAGKTVETAVLTETVETGVTMKTGETCSGASSAD